MRKRRNMKYFWSILWVAIAVFCLPGRSQADEYIEGWTDNGLHYREHGTVDEEPAQKAVVIDGYEYNGENSAVIIPERIEGAVVYALDRHAFSEDPNVEEVILPDSMKYMESDAFVDCINLKKIDLRNVRAAYRPNHGFSRILKGCSNLEELIIGDEADFEIGYKSPRNFDIFYEDTTDNLKRITIGKKMKDISETLFYGPNLEYITISPGNQEYSSRNGILYSADGKSLLCCPTAYQEENVVIPDGVTEISSVGFESCSNVKSISIPASVTSIRGVIRPTEETVLIVEKGSYGEQYLLEYEYPGIHPDGSKVEGSFVPVTGITGIPSEIEAGEEYSLNGVVLPENAAIQEITWELTSFEATGASISGNVLKASYPGKLVLMATVKNGYGRGKDYTQRFAVNVVLPGDHAWKPENSPEEIPTLKPPYSGGQTDNERPGGTGKPSGSQETPSGEEEKTSEIPDSEDNVPPGQHLLPVKNKIYQVGSGKYKVTKSAAKNGTVAYLGSRNKKAASVTIPSAVKINGYTFKVTRISKNAFKNNRYLKKVRIGSNVQVIESKAFANCKKLAQVIFGANLTTIGDSAFQNCTALKKAVIPSKTTSIGKSAFRGCTKLTTATLGSRVKKLGAYAFYGDKKLKSVTVKSTVLKSVGKQCFGKTYQKLTIKVPAKKVKSYQKILKNKGLSKKAVIRKR